MLKIVWHSNSPTTNSGYGKQTALFVPRIAALGHEIAAIASPYSFGGSPIEWNGIPILGTARDIAGNDVILRNHEYFGADLTITLADPFGLLKSAEELSQVPLASWFPVDCDPAGYGDVAFLRESGAVPVAMSRFGQRVLENEGCEPLFVPLAVDTGIYRPGPRTYRDTLPGVTDDTFVIGLCAMNRDPVRKGFSEQFLAFSRFHARHPDSFLAVHSGPGGKPGLSLHGMAAMLGISTVVGFPDGYSYDLGLITEEQMAAWYNGLDVLSACSYGEGFGLPLVEAQACGVPVITTDASAMSELCGSGFLVSGTPYWTDGHTSWWTRPDVTDIDHAYEAAWQAREKQGRLTPDKPAYDFAQQYDADKVFGQYWVPALAQLEDMLA
jgi:glycosyltransferase involved in cell wall biosynthesis